MVLHVALKGDWAVLHRANHQQEVMWQGSIQQRRNVLTCMLCAKATTGARTNGADRGPISIDGEMR